MIFSAELQLQYNALCDFGGPFQRRRSLLPTFGSLIRFYSILTLALNLSMILDFAQYSSELDHQNQCNLFYLASLVVYELVLFI